MHGATFGMAVKAGVESANAQGLYAPGDMQARIVEILTIIENLAPEFDVDLSATSYSGGSSFPEKETKGVAFVVDGIKWFDYRDAKEAGTVKAGFPDFKSYEGDGASLYLNDQEGNPNPEGQSMAKIADAAKALA